LMSVDIETATAPDKTAVLKPGLPKKLFNFTVLQDRNNYDVTADGQRFLINTGIDATNSPINVVLNWLSGVKR